MSAKQPQSVAEFREAVDGLTEAVRAEPRGAAPDLEKPATPTSELPSPLLTPTTPTVAADQPTARHPSRSPTRHRKNGPSAA